VEEVVETARVVVDNAKAVEVVVVLLFSLLSVKLVHPRS
jgi:hypothetical protein